MYSLINWLESVFLGIPLPLLEVWGRFGYILGLFIMIVAFGGFTFRPGDRWGFGKERQSWDLRALLSILFTIFLVFVTGYLGSFLVLVPGAQTFESLKDLSVFLCITLFGYPALLAIPFVYGLSDLMEGVPPEYLWDWILGYFINPACFWIGYQLIGRSPDFRKFSVWLKYILFVAIFMLVEPLLWGYLCSTQFTPEISYRTITPALFFTTAITWVIAPFAMLVALPIARKYGFFWAEIPGHVKEFVISWKEGKFSNPDEGIDSERPTQGLPIRMFLVTPFIILVLVMVGITAYLALKNSELGAAKLASRLHEEISNHIHFRLENYIKENPGKIYPIQKSQIQSILSSSTLTSAGKAFIIDRRGHLIATSNANLSNDKSELEVSLESERIYQNIVKNLNEKFSDLSSIQSPHQLTFDIVTAKPLSRQVWLMQVTPFDNQTLDWLIVTSIPSSYYLEGVNAGNSQTAMVFAIALVLSLLIAIILAGIVAGPIRKITFASREIAKGDFSQRVPLSNLEELGALAVYFNNMASQLQDSFSRTKTSESRFRNIAETIEDVFWITSTNKEKIIYISKAYEKIWGRSCESLYKDPYQWVNAIHEDDREAVRIASIKQIAEEYDLEYRIIRPNGEIRWVRDRGFPAQDLNGEYTQIVGVARDISEEKRFVKTILDLNTNLEAKVLERTEDLRKANEELKNAFIKQELVMTELENTQDHLLRSEKMAALGQLAAGMTHELKTPLGAIVSSNRAILEILNEDIDLLSSTLMSMSEEDGRVFRSLLKDCISLLASPDNFPSRAQRKQMIEDLKNVGIENVTKVTEMVLDLGIYQVNEKILELVKSENHLKILKSLLSIIILIRMSKVISLATGKATHVVDALKNYLRPNGDAQEIEMTQVDIISEIESILTLYHSKLKQGIELIKDYQTTAFCRGNGNKLNQVWINLLNNSLQAMNYQGKLEIVVREENHWIVVSFTDSGQGIPEEIKNKIFEPFFTTKKHGEGIGLGLDITKKIINQLGGKIEFESVPGRTKFSVFLRPAESIIGGG